MTSPPPQPPASPPPSGEPPEDSGPQYDGPQDIPPAYEYDLRPPGAPFGPQAGPPPPPPPPPIPPPGPPPIDQPPPPPGYTQPYPGDYPSSPPPHGYGPPPSRSRISIAMVIIGPFVYAAINLVVGFAALIAGGMLETQTTGSSLVFGLAAIGLLLIAFGGGTLLLRRNSPQARGLGIGLMVGWALMSVLTAGFCTGINPEMYRL
ncbi:hypothetical protein [Mycolicibacterium goodii]|uniref:hypothetical protein n=2 Tax=Mycolicibacterium goodii TaxID=134601 RepID=UPI00256EB6DE|nr:hypothetical protein [Mycolicibacterium goodii]